MVPIEALMLTLWLVFGLVGRVRGFAKELGATVLFTTTTLVVLRFGDAAYAVASPATSWLAGGNDAAARFAFYVAVFALSAYLAYEGETIVFKGSSPPGTMGRVLDIGIGLLNGWLVIGGLWYYLDKLGYPLPHVQAPQFALGKTLVQLTPLNILPDGREFVYLLLFLVFLVVLKVVR
jgi:hypothetical protein